MSVHDLQAPREDRAVLAYPPLDHAVALLAANRRHFNSASQEILGKPLGSLRASARREVVQTAQNYLAQAGEPFPDAPDEALFVAGHQPELFHPGVWAKNFALCGLARRCGGLALNLVVDNDTAKNTLLHVSAGERIAQVPFDHWQSAVPFEERRVADEQLFRALPRSVATYQSDWPFTPILEEFWAEACRQDQRTPLLGERLVAARRVFERRWGCVNLEVPLSAVSQTNAFAFFACDLLERLPSLWSIYNGVVQDYRRRYRMRSRNHPVPDLAREGDWLEAPLWAWRAGQQRRGRLFARHASAGLELRAGAETWPILRRGASAGDFIAQFHELQAAGYKLRSRALTTTLFARVFLGDLFLHGLGGGKYDELTDEIIRRFYGMEPPAFLILTATLLLPFPTLSVTENERRRLKSRKHDLWWNPQRHFSDGPPAAGVARAEKLRWIQTEPHSSAESRVRYQTLRKLTAELRPFVQSETEQVAERLEQVGHDLRVRQVRSRRDYAFCLHPEASIRPFCEQFLQS